MSGEAAINDVNMLSTDIVYGEQLSPRSSEGKDPRVFADIYQDNINIAIWQRELADQLALSVDELLMAKPTLQASLSVTPKSAYASVNEALGATATSGPLSEDIAELVDMFCCLFDLKRAGLRLAVLRRAMCPRFHVDKVPCRLVTTYQGVATEWLPDHSLDRTKLGPGSQGNPDEQSGLFLHSNDIYRLNKGDVALLKGEGWEGNEGAGLVHRSPSLPVDKQLATECRLLLTLDFMAD